MEDDIYKKIKRLESDLLNFKTTQPVGSDSVITYTTMTNNQWDYTGILLESYVGAPYGNARFIITFTASTQRAPFGRARIFGEAGGKPINYVSVQGTAFRPTEVAVNVTDYILSLTPLEMADSSLLKFQISVNGPVGVDFKLKFIVDATDTGRMQVLLSNPQGGQIIIP